MAIPRRGFISNNQQVVQAVLGPTQASKRNIEANISGYSRGTNIADIEPEIRNPLLNVVNFYLPYNYRVLNQWLRYYDKFHPLIRNSLDLHSEVPWSNFSLSLEDVEVLGFYEDMVQDLDLLTFFTRSTREYFSLGESIPYLEWNQDLNCFSSLQLLNPDFIKIVVNPFTFKTRFFRDLQSDLDLMRLLEVRDSDINRRIDISTILDDTPAEIFEALQSRDCIEIPDTQIAHIARKTNAYDIRGTSLILSCLKDLMYEDKLREAQYVIAGRHILPIEHWTIGLGSEWLPQQEELNEFNRLLQSLGNDPLFSLVTPPGYQYQAYGLEGKILNLIRDFEFVENRILTAMFTSKAMTHGEGPTYSNAAVAMEILQARYDTVKDLHILFVIKKIFEPVAIANEFYAPTKGEILGHYRLANSQTQLRQLQNEIQIELGLCDNLKQAQKLRCHLNRIVRAIANDSHKLLIPTFRWSSRLNLRDENQRINYLFRLRDKLQIPLRNIFDILQLDFDESMRQLDEEKKRYPALYPTEARVPSKELTEFAEETAGFAEESELPTGIERLVEKELTSPIAKE